MESVYAHLAERVVTKLRALEQSSSAAASPRLLVAVTGVPGAGKSTTARQVCSIINDSLIPSSPASPTAASMSMDGFHLTRATLDTMPDPAEAHRRRGAPFTFDAQGTVDMIRSCRDSSKDISAPSFDHAIKDPVEGGTVIPKSARIVIFEGNYLLSSEKPWDEIADLVDERWFVAIDQKLVRERLATRHFKAGIADSMEGAYERADGSDAMNGAYIKETLYRVDVTIDSIVDAAVATV